MFDGCVYNDTSRYIKKEIENKIKLRCNKKMEFTL